MKDNVLLESVSKDNKIASMRIPKACIESIIDTYNDVLLSSLLENGTIEVGNGMVIEIVQLLDRVHVLRGITYRSNRKYKLKLTMEDELYQKIEKYYDRLQEEIK